MINWLIKRGVKKHITEWNDSVKSSFTNIRNDMSHISKWITHFQKRDDHHTENFNKILERLALIESKLEKGEEIEISESSEDSIYESSFNLSKNETEKWDDLTDVQQNLAWLILRLNKEDPDIWFTTRQLGEEFYPNKDYSKVRSTLVHYLNILEDFGFIERKRSSNQSLIKSKKENLPPPRNSKEIIIDMKSSKKSKKK